MYLADKEHQTRYCDGPRTNKGKRSSPSESDHQELVVWFRNKRSKARAQRLGISGIRACETSPHPSAGNPQGGRAAFGWMRTMNHKSLRRQRHKF